MPGITADLVASRPIHLAVIDGIYTMTSGQLPNQQKNRIHGPVHFGVLIAGLNCVNTDAVATAVMGLDPMADRGTSPVLAEQLGVGTRDLNRIEVVGTSRRLVIGSRR